MWFFHHLPFIRPLQPSIAAIGNFDGLHLGHQALLKQLNILAKQKGYASTVILFEPQPQEFFHPSHAPARLQSLSEKLEGLKKFHIQQVICLSFNQALANRTPQAFIQQLENYQVKAVLVGQDFRFGKNRAGDIALLQQQKNLETLVMKEICRDDAVRVSSTLVREALAKGDFRAAMALLGRPYTLSGKVMHGQKRGRLFNFPTANLFINRLRSPLHGVYVVKVYLTSGASVPGVANVGVRPTVSQEDRWFLEVFLFTDEALALYGQRIKVEFVQKIREEKRFESFEALQAQIQQDVECAKDFFLMPGELC